MNPADICRECELTSKTRELEEENRALRQAGDSMEHCLGLIIKNYAENIITRDSIIAWHKAKGEAE